MFLLVCGPKISKKKLTSRKILRVFKRVLLFISIFWAGSALFAQNKDSLLKVLNTQGDDTNKVITYKNLMIHHLFYEYDLDQTMEYAQAGIKLAKKIKSNKWSGKMHAMYAYVEQNYTHKIPEAIQNNFKALEYYDKGKNEFEKIPIYINLSILYNEYNQLEEAEKYSLLAEEYTLRFNQKEDYALVCFNLGGIYSNKKMKDKSFSYLTKALNYYKETDQILEAARCEFNLLNLRVNEEMPLNERKKAIEKYQELRSIFKENEMLDFYLGTTVNLGVQYNEIGDPANGEKYLLEAEQICTQDKNYVMLSDIYSPLAKSAELQNDFLKKSDYLLKLLTVKDSVFNQNTSKVISEVQVKYQTEKIEANNKLLTQEAEIKDLELENKDIEIAKSNTVKFALIGGLTLIIIFTSFLYNRFQVTNKQKKTIEEQKLLVEIKQKEITDSIKYAKRLQDAILPSLDTIEKHLPESFLLYKPKDIVAGDFYFFDKVNDFTFIAVADCTGHGVPGALVSVVCSNALHRCIKEFNLSNPGEILDKTREIVVETFEKSGQSVRDGMDIALCVIKGNQLSFAGANNSLWVLRGEDYVHLPANKQPIGKYEVFDKFVSHELVLEKEDKVYLFTDGYCDQFGGPKGKKYKLKQLLTLLKEHSFITIKDQKQVLDKSFESWRGDMEQIDDVCIMGIKF